VDTLKLDLIAAGDILEALRPGLEDADYCPSSIAATFRWPTWRPATKPERMGKPDGSCRGHRG
jgi:hypothetical protein